MRDEYIQIIIDGGITSVAMLSACDLDVLVEAGIPKMAALAIINYVTKEAAKRRSSTTHGVVNTGVMNVGDGGMVGTNFGKMTTVITTTSVENREKKTTTNY